MAETALQNLAAEVPRGNRIMGIDLGEKTIGLALSDRSLSIATPLETLKRRKFTKDAETMAELVDRHDVGGFLFGLPVNMDGSEGPRCQSTRQFARNLSGKIALPYAFWDERLSTAAVERVLIGEADMTRRRRAEVVDRAAAAYILQGALDSVRQA